MNTLADRIKTERKANKLTQEKLGDLVGVGKSSVSQWESGLTKQLVGENLLRTAKALNVNPNWLSTGKGDKHKIDYIDSTAIRQELYNIAPSLGEQRPPVIDEESWKALPPKTRALVEDFLIKSSDGTLKEDHVKVLQNMVDALSKE